MISAQQSRDLQRLERLRADPSLQEVRLVLIALGSLLRANADVALAAALAGTPVHQTHYTINKLLNLIDGGP